MCTAQNIKNRLNKHNVIRILTKINEYCKDKTFESGVIIYGGICEENKEILECIVPNNKIEIFYYNCSDKFNTEIVSKYFDSYSGSIIFANGDECIVYSYDTQFRKVKHLNANLIKRQRKGGQSAVRFSRLAEISREEYITRIIDTLNILTTKTNIVFGSAEILDMIFQKRKCIYIPITNGGFALFNKDTISNTQYWLSHLMPKINNDDKLQFVITCLQVDIDRLDFSPENKGNMEYFIIKEDDFVDNNKKVVLNKGSRFYKDLQEFDYIGVKYFSNEYIGQSDDDLTIL